MYPREILLTPSPTSVVIRVQVNGFYYDSHVFDVCECIWWFVNISTHSIYA